MSKPTINNDGGSSSKKKSGKFTPEESQLVRKAVEEFCAAKQIEVTRLCSECDHKAELKGAWMEIAKALPHRSVQSVYRHGLRQLHPFKRGAWSDEECDYLVDLVTRFGKKWATIQQKLNRSADACRDKYREMGDDYVKGRWKEPETQLLLKLIREHLKADPSTDIVELNQMAKKAEAEGRSIPFMTISKRMEKRSRLSCLKKWQKLTHPEVLKDYNITQGKDTSSLIASINEYNRSGFIDRPRPTEQQDMTTKPPRKKIRPETYSAPTAGAAAAMAAGTILKAAEAVPDPERESSSLKVSSTEPEPEQELPGMPDDDFDQVLLTELANTGATRSSQVDWESFRLENAKERWNQLMIEFEEENDGELGGGELGLSEMAQAILDRKASAQRAAETVEAVDLPALVVPGTLELRTKIESA